MHHDIEQYVHDPVVYIYLFHTQEFLLPKNIRSNQRKKAGAINLLVLFEN
jgi:hypothetical protein